MRAVFTEWLEYGFMKNALLAVLIITPLFGILGTMIVNKKMAFFSDSLGHSALTGIAIGAVLGMKDTTLSMILFAIVFALLLNKIAEKSTASTDTLISVFLRQVWHLDLLFCQREAISVNIQHCWLEIF